MYEKLSHYIYSELLSAHINAKQFDFFNHFHWLIIGALGAAIMALVMVVLLRFRVRSVMLLLAGSGRTAAALDDQINHNLPTMLYVQTTTSARASTRDYLYYHKLIQDLVPVDFTILFCIILFFFITVLICLGYRYRKAHYARTTLMLELAIGYRTFERYMTSFLKLQAILDLSSA